MLLNYYKSTGRLLILFLLLNLTTTLIFSYILFKNENVENNGSMISITALSWQMYVFTTVILAPLIETYIFQYLIIENTRKHIGNKIIGVFISALVFGLMHTYSAPYVLKCTISGLSYGAAYVTFKNKNNNPS